jgi:hypothetical protein
MRILVIGLIALGAVAASIPQAQSQNSARPTICAAAHRKRNRIAAQSIGDFLNWQKSHSRHERDVWDCCDAQSAAGSGQKRTCYRLIDHLVGEREEHRRHIEAGALARY